MATPSRIWFPGDDSFGDSFSKKRDTGIESDFGVMFLKCGILIVYCSNQPSISDWVDCTKRDVVYFNFVLTWAPVLDYMVKTGILPSNCIYHDWLYF